MERSLKVKDRAGCQVGSTTNGDAGKSNPLQSTTITHRNTRDNKLHASAHSAREDGTNAVETTAERRQQTGTTAETIAEGRQQTEVRADSAQAAVFIVLFMIGHVIANPCLSSQSISCNCAPSRWLAKLHPVPSSPPKPVFRLGPLPPHPWQILIPLALARPLSKMLKFTRRSGIVLGSGIAHPTAPGMGCFRPPVRAFISAMYCGMIPPTTGLCYWLCCPANPLRINTPEGTGYRYRIPIAHRAPLSRPGASPFESL